jgi:hypothetical protein
MESKPFATVEFSQGENVTLSCDASGREAVRWFFAETAESKPVMLTESGDVHLRHINKVTTDARVAKAKSYLTICNAQLNDSGLYICVKRGTTETITRLSFRGE